MKLKHAILSLMDRDTMKSIVEELELDGVDRRSRDDMFALLSRTHRATAELLFEKLSEIQVKTVCELVGADGTGRRAELIRRLLADMPTPSNRKRPPSADRRLSDPTINSTSYEIRHRMNEHEPVEEFTQPQPVRLPDPPKGMTRVNKTELVWPGKYNEDGTPKEVARVSLPFQVIERVNESRATREARKDRGPTLFDVWERDEGDTFETGWRNKLIWGDNMLVAGSLLDQLAGRIDLIYIDPPFATGTDFSFTAEIGDDEGTVLKEQSVIEEKAYRDTWGRGMSSYLSMMQERLILIKDLLSERGSLYVHCDARVNSHLRLLLDDIFGPTSFRNQITWKRTGARSGSVFYNTISDTLLFYTRNDQYTWNVQYTPYDEKYLDDFFRFSDEHGRYRQTILTAPGTRKGSSGKPWRGYDPTVRGRHWAIPSYMRPQLSQQTNDDVQLALDELDAMGRILWPKKEGGVPSFKQYVHEMGGVELQDIWSDIRPIGSQAIERVDYSTQKPEALVERIIKSSTNEGDVVADFFCGSGTTMVAAEKLKRRWIGCDLSRWAVHVARKRILEIEGSRAFEVLNLGRYERQYWQGVTFGVGKEKSLTEHALFEYLAFILRLYGAQPVSGLTHMHGKKGRSLVHIGSIDAPVTIDEINHAIDECAKLNQPELHVLGWEWEMGLNDLMVPEARKRGVKLSLFRIPREVMEEQAVDKGDIRFFELAYLEVESKQPKKLAAQVTLMDFVIPDTELIPDEIRSNVRKWSDFIDYWSIDWDFQNDSFVQGWVAYRTRQERKLPLTSDMHKYDKAGRYTVLVKVIDIFGNDTSQAHEIEVG